jgi:hypothetical protein
VWAFELFLRHSRDSNESTEELMNKGPAIQPKSPTFGKSSTTDEWSVEADET